MEVFNSAAGSTQNVPGYRIVGNKSSLPGGYAGTAPFGATAAGAAGITYRTEHYTGPFGAFTQPKLIYAGVYNLQPGGENANPTPFSKRVSMEVGGTLLPVTINGVSTSQSLAPSALWISAAVNTTVGLSTAFQVRDYSSLVAAQNYVNCGWRSAITGPDASNVVEFPLSAGADLTASGTAGSFAQKNNNPWIRPTCIIGIPLDPKNHKAVLIVGDSIGAGSEGSGTTPTPTAENYFGFIEPALGTAVAWCQMSSGAARFADFLVAHAIRDQLFQYATSVICELGFNDAYDGVTLAVLQSRAIQTWRVCGSFGAAVFQTTLTPSSTGSWASAAAQTPSVATARIPFNNWLRDGAPMVAGFAVATGTASADRIGATGHPLTGYFEVADLIEVNSSNVFTRDGGRFYCGPGNNTAYTPDGTHYNATGYATLRPGIVVASLK